MSDLFTGIEMSDILYVPAQSQRCAKSYILFDWKWRFVCMIYCASGWHIKCYEYPSSYLGFLKDGKVGRVQVIVE